MIQEEKQSGFVAGTLVHTDKGLVPIEQIKIGDFVLSKPDNDPKAPNTYKRVVSAFKSEEKKMLNPLTIVNAVSADNWDEYPEGSIEESFLVAEDHPIWIDRVGSADEEYSFVLKTTITSNDQMGWKLASFLRSGSELKLIDGELATCVIDCTRELKTTDIDWLFYITRRGSNEPSIVWDSSDTKIKSYYAADVLMFEDEEYENYGAFISESDLPQPLIDFGRFWFSSRRALHIYGADVVKTFTDKPNFSLRTSETTVNSKKSSLDACDYVYTIKIEEFHTYFIGKLGLWVHDASTNIS